MTTIAQAAAVLDGQTITAGDPVKVDGHRGTFRFRGLISTSSATWVDVYGGTPNRERARSFALELVHPARRKR